MAIRLILCAVIGYALGNLQTGLLIGRLSGNVDLREHGSGSSGSTNALRVLGRRSAALTLIGDALKGVLASLVGLWIGGETGGMLGCVFCVVGHIWPVFFGFHGGKGIATSIGGLLVLMPLQTGIMVLVGIVALVISKIVSVGSLLGAASFLITGAIAALREGNMAMLAFVVAMTALVVYAHRQNIARLLAGNENRLDVEKLKKRR